MGALVPSFPLCSEPHTVAPLQLELGGTSDHSPGAWHVRGPNAEGALQGPVPKATGESRQRLRTTWVLCY